jgi:hypothetical protein
MRHFCTQFHWQFSRASPSHLLLIQVCEGVYLCMNHCFIAIVFTNQYWYCNHKYVSRCCLKSVAHLFLWTWLHQTEYIVQYDCDVRAWLCSVIKFNMMTKICLILLHSVTVREHSIWLAAVLQHFDTTQFILTIIEINMILFHIWITEQNFGQNIWWKGDNLEHLGIGWEDDIEIDL